MQVRSHCGPCVRVPRFILGFRDRRRSNVSRRCSTRRRSRRSRPTRTDEQRICQQQRRSDEEQYVEDERENYRSDCSARRAFLQLVFRTLLRRPWKQTRYSASQTSKISSALDLRGRERHFHLFRRLCLSESLVSGVV